MRNGVSSSMIVTSAVDVPSVAFTGDASTTLNVSSGSRTMSPRAFTTMTVDVSPAGMVTTPLDG